MLKRYKPADKGLIILENNMTKVFNAAQVAGCVLSAINADKKSTDTVQIALIQGTQHAAFAGNGDITQLERLVKGLRGADRKAIMVWLREFSCITFVEGKPAKCNAAARKELNGQHDGADALVEYLEQQPCYADYVPDPDQIVRELNAIASAEGTIKRIRNAVKEGKPVHDAGLATYLEAALNEYKADQHAAIVDRVAELKAEAADTVELLVAH